MSSSVSSPGSQPAPQPVVQPVVQPVSQPVSQIATNVLTALLEARTGQQISAYRSWRLDTALKPLLRDRKLETLDQLVTLLLEGNDRVIGDRIVDALLNQETSFYRDALVFEALVEAIAEAEQKGRRIRIWSAGCATGQEPLSLAMLFAERHEQTGAPVPEIVATDVSTTAITRARSARFTQFEIQRGLPIRRMMRWFDGVDNEWVAKPDLVKLVAFRRLNLVADPAPSGQFDVVLCRNVLLYLAADAKRQVFGAIAQALRPGGLLVLGAGETVIGQTSAFEPSKRFRGFYETSLPGSPQHARRAVVA